MSFSCETNTKQSITYIALTNLSRLMTELCSFKCFKLYSLIFAFAYAQIKIVMLIKSGHNCVTLNTRKLINHLKQAQKSISNLSNL